MSVKCSVYIAASVDGFIARADGDIDWLHNPAYQMPHGGDLGYRDFIGSVDAIVMGSATFEKVLSFKDWPYEEMPVFVLSSRDLSLPSHLQDKVRVENLSPGKLVSQLGSEGFRHLYIDGGKIIQGFLRAGLIHELTITQIPLLLGGGIPLFGSLGVERPLEHRSTTTFDNGFVQVRYRVIAQAGGRDRESDI